MDDPCINLLNIDSFYNRINSSSKHRKPNNIDTDFVVEPWDDNSGNRQELQTQPPSRMESQKPKTKIIIPRTPGSRIYNRQRSIDTSQQPTRIIQVVNRPISCHHSTFTELCIKPPQMQYNKIVEKMFDNNNSGHKSPRKNSTGQYRQICLKNILYSKKISNSKKILNVTSQNRPQSFTWNDYYKYIQQTPPLQPTNQHKNKSVTMIGSEKDNTIKNFRLKLKTLCIKQ